MNLSAGEFLTCRLVGGRRIRCVSGLRLDHLNRTSLVALDAFDCPILVRLAQEIPQPTANECDEKTASILRRNSLGPFGGGEELETVAGAPTDEPLLNGAVEQRGESIGIVQVGGLQVRKPRRCRLAFRFLDPHAFARERLVCTSRRELDHRGGGCHIGAKTSTKG